jgi:hypothetical protein
MQLHNLRCFVLRPVPASQLCAGMLVNRSVFVRLTQLRKEHTLASIVLWIRFATRLLLLFCNKQTRG